jgi:hypothetical protein
VCARTRTTVQFLRIRSSLRATDLLLSSICFLACWVNAFFFERRGAGCAENEGARDCVARDLDKLALG